MKKENIDIQNIAHQININQQIYDELPEETFDAHILRMIQRLKMQKKLFIKEIANATQITTSELVANKNSTDNPSASSILDKYEKSTKNKNAEAYLSLLIELEQRLYDQYNAFLYGNKNDEITKMILGNQANEIKRDIRILESLHEYA